MNNTEIAVFIVLLLISVTTLTWSGYLVGHKSGQLEASQNNYSYEYQTNITTTATTSTTNIIWIAK